MSTFRRLAFQDIKIKLYSPSDTSYLCEVIQDDGKNDPGNPQGFYKIVPSDNSLGPINPYRIYSPRWMVGGLNPEQREAYAKASVIKRLIFLTLYDIKAQSSIGKKFLKTDQLPDG